VKLFTEHRLRPFVVPPSGGNRAPPVGAALRSSPPSQREQRRPPTDEGGERPKAVARVCVERGGRVKMFAEHRLRPFVVPPSGGSRAPLYPRRAPRVQARATRELSFPRPPRIPTGPRRERCWPARRSRRRRPPGGPISTSLAEAFCDLPPLAIMSGTFQRPINHDPAAEPMAPPLPPG
jgi:hypothetical protein